MFTFHRLAPSLARAQTWPRTMPHRGEQVAASCGVRREVGLVRLMRSLVDSSSGHSLLNPVGALSGRRMLITSAARARFAGYCSVVYLMRGPLVNRSGADDPAAVSRRSR